MKTALFFLLALIPLQTFAFKLSPMVSHFATEGREKNQSFFLENPTEKKMAVEISILKRTIAVDGQESRSETEDFLVYPPQVVLKPGEKRTIRVSWKGTEKVEIEQSYRLIAEELPVDLEKQNTENRTQLKFLLKYVASLYVTPPSSRGKVSVVTAETTTDKDSKQKKWKLHLKNSGTGHQVLSTIKIKFKIGKKSFDLNSDDLKPFAAENILAKSERIFLLDWPENIPFQKFTPEITFSETP